MSKVAKMVSIRLTKEDMDAWIELCEKAGQRPVHWLMDRIMTALHAKHEAFAVALPNPAKTFTSGPPDHDRDPDGFDR